MRYPTTRMRRLRQSAALRDMVAETVLAPDDLMMPLFVRPGKGVRRPIASMPGVCQLSVDTAVEEGRELLAAGVRSVILFGIPEYKDAEGTSGYADDGIVQEAVRALRGALPDLLVCTDVCLCEYTSHGHCGVLDGDRVDNDATLDLLARMAVSHARAGAQMVAPSDMMDGRVGAVRAALDADGLQDTVIMAYSAKYASSFYGPFRDAAESPPRFGDRRGYQMDPRNRREALTEVDLDLAEGADIVMVKPALAYLDVIHAVREHVQAPIAAYNVSGEYAMVKAAAAQGWIDEKRAVLEILHSIRRAGADLILTYWAKEAAQWLRTL